MTEYEWKVQPDRNDPEMYEVAGVYLVAGNLPLEDANLIAASEGLDKSARDVCAVISAISDWDDGCLYVNGKSTPEPQGPLQKLMDAIEKAATASPPQS